MEQEVRELTGVRLLGRLLASVDHLERATGLPARDGQRVGRSVAGQHRQGPGRGDVARLVGPEEIRRRVIQNHARVGLETMEMPQTPLADQFQVRDPEIRSDWDVHQVPRRVVFADRGRAERRVGDEQISIHRVEGKPRRRQGRHEERRVRQRQQAPGFDLGTRQNTTSWEAGGTEIPPLRDVIEIPGRRVRASGPEPGDSRQKSTFPLSRFRRRMSLASQPPVAALTSTVLAD